MLQTGAWTWPRDSLADWLGLEGIAGERGSGDEGVVWGMAALMFSLMLFAASVRVFHRRGQAVEAHRAGALSA